ncbi:NAD(P)H-hydrate dehydratase [Veillonella fallax]|uniref:Bifunctional NAD(P)H-hydrate repair enzyme n=1 Tax=Veillonella fallax TaxID=2881272 RepID=A0ABS8F012_9FIRM|nr:NAD(P)H-hydrate dehydratase [Veillonella fallax]MCC2155610.1 NAD(P)H-hydrate dehydratase [Veillonella fallax]
MQILTTEDARYIDQEVPKQLGVSLEILMENAGRGIVDALWGQYDLFSLDNARSINSFVLFICGTGNNGADGLVAARHLLEQGVPVQIVLVGDTSKCSDLFAVQLERCEAMGGIIDTYDEFNDWSNVAIAVEGIMGTGLTGRLRDLTIDVLHDIDTMRSQYNFDLWAIDVPAGLDASSGQISEGTLTYDYTVTFGAIKQGLLLYPGKAIGGTAIVAPLGAPWQHVLVDRDSTITIDSDLAETLINYRVPMAHKGVNGNTLIVGGSSDMVGAPMLAAEAAVHSGAGKVTLGVPDTIKQVVQGRIIPEVMVTSIDENESLYDGRQVVAIGPGLGRTTDIPDVVNQVIDSCEGALVIDADALYALGHVGSVDKDALRDGHIESVYKVQKNLPYCVMTPHLGEFSRLIDLPIKWIERHYITLARAFAKAHQVVLLLKGIPSVVALPDGTVYVNTIGNAGMGTGGMGDVLTGIIAGFISQGYSLQDGAILGVYVHSRSADILSDTKTWGYTPSDVSTSIGCVISELLGE